MSLYNFGKTEKEKNRFYDETDVKLSEKYLKEMGRDVVGKETNIRYPKKRIP